MSSLQKPPPAPIDVQAQYAQAKKDFEQAFKEFHNTVFKSKVLDKNKSAAKKNTEHHIIEKLITSTINLDNVNVGEGMVALVSTMIRELLSMRDRINELEYDLCVSKKDILELQDAKKK
jgi:hypothetical protein